MTGCVIAKRIVCVDNLVDAWLRDDVLEVMISPIVDLADSCVAPVRAFLREVCSAQIDREIVETDEFAWGEAERTLYDVYQECPGPEVKHTCKERAISG